MKRALTILYCVLIGVLPFSGCSSDPTGKTFSYDIAYPLSSLDPQYTTDATARMILANICEGLLVQAPDGSLSPGMARSYDISGDRLVYTFYLRGGSAWSGEDSGEVTADDFVFAFRRLFNPAAPSPFADDYRHIKNAADILAGLKSENLLGVRAEDSHTLVITLERQSPFFLQLLCETAAMPCSRVLFEEAMGRYGLEPKLTGANGPFYVSRWTDKQITLLQNENYHGETPVTAGGVNLHIARDKTLENFLDGGADVAMLPYAQLEQAKELGCDVEGFDKTTWCIVFNQQNAVWGSPLLRQALAGAIDYGYFAQKLGANFTPSSVLIPPASLLGDKPYRSFTDEASPLSYDAAEAIRIFKMGLDALEIESLPATTFYVPDTDGHALSMGFVQQSWQKNLSAFVNVKPIPFEEIEKRYASGDYQMMLMPFSQNGAGPDSILQLFTSSSPGNCLGYGDPRYDQLLADARNQTSTETAAIKYAQAEKTLLADAVVIPVYNETIYYAAAKGVSGVGIYPFGDKILFRGALRK